MRILLTNNQISTRTGSELYLCEIAEALHAAGHDVACFSLTCGPLSERLKSLGIPVSDDLRALPRQPDVIHGQHIIETTLAAMTYRTVPVVSFCHGPEAWQENACKLPNVVHWVAVDYACHRRLVEDEQIDPDRVTVLLNHYDERKYQPRTPLPAKPRKALLLSNNLNPQHPAFAAISSACALHGIELSTAGANLGGRVENVEQLLPQFDLVFAKARTAIEALAVGCAVVQAEHFGAGQLVRTENFNELRPLNFGYRSMTYPLTVEHFSEQIAKYDAQDAGEVSRRIREEATLSATMTNLLALYEHAIAMKASLQDYDPSIAAADFLRMHLYLSKLPMDSLHQAPGECLRLPTGVIPAGAVAECWARISTPHIAWAQKNSDALRSLAEQKQAEEKNQAAIKREERKQNSARKTQELISELAAVKAELAKFRTDAREKVKHKSKLSAQKSRTLLQRVRGYFAQHGL